jgi:hypothetical protein
MNKEQLKTKVDALQANLDVRKSELSNAQVELNVALNELADAGKPVISESLAADLVDQISEMFSDVVSNADTSDLSPEFSIGYSNEIVLECLDMSNIGISDHDIQTVLEEFFAIKIDEDDDNS